MLDPRSSPGKILAVVYFVSLTSFFGCKSPSNQEYTNHLINETSPYLLQHAHNPVDWYPWGDEALTKAKNEDKPIILSIGYSACHWCHVMERESFSDTAVARIMNANFISIKVDREERPEIDNIYISAVRTMGGSTGWPLNVFLTPDAKPIFGGTYFPPESMQGRPSWTDVMNNILRSFREKRSDIEEQAQKLLGYMARADGEVLENFVISGLEKQDLFTQDHLDSIYENLRFGFDTVYGGFGDTPKFPSTGTIKFLLRYQHFTEKEEGLHHALLSLDKMFMGGLFDQLGGGFARYATDRKWLVPHFEKMLYDNAQLVDVFSEGYLIRNKPIYKEAVERTVAFLQREMLSPENGFYSTLDADTEEEEGKFYIWTKREIDSILGPAADLFNAFYGVSQKGNFEGKNILYRTKSYQKFADEHNMSVKDLASELKSARNLLYEARNKRIRPGLDDKIILSWNAMMNSALSKAYKVFQVQEYKDLAVKNMDFLLKSFRVNGDDHELYHTYKNGKAKYHGFLDDYAFLIEALLSLYEITFNEQYLELADHFTRYLMEHFQDPYAKVFFYTSAKQKDILLRKKEFYDGSTPSGNSTMSDNLQRLGIIMDNNEYKETSVIILRKLLTMIIEYPSSFSRWANTLVNYVHPIHEIAVVGPKYEDIANRINRMFIPNMLIMGSVGEEETKFALLEGKYAFEKTLIYVCKDYACKLPVDNMDDFRTQIN